MAIENLPVFSVQIENGRDEKGYMKFFSEEVAAPSFEAVAAWYEQMSTIVVYSISKQKPLAYGIGVEYEQKGKEAEKGPGA